MKYQFNPSINFHGRCEEALNFYKECLGGEIEFLNRFRETGFEIPPDHQDKIVHAEFRADGVYFMASDGMPGESDEASSGMIGLSINFQDTAEEKRVFAALSAGGEVVFPLEKQFWGALYGICVDAFGVRWELNCQLPDEQTH